MSGIAVMLFAVCVFAPLAIAAGSMADENRTKASATGVTYKRICRVVVAIFGNLDNMYHERILPFSGILSSGNCS
jgi:hypothetical protein